MFGDASYIVDVIGRKHAVRSLHKKGLGYLRLERRPVCFGHFGHQIRPKIDRPQSRDRSKICRCRALDLIKCRILNSSEKEPRRANSHVIYGVDKVDN